MARTPGVVQSATTAAGIIAEIEALQPGAGYYTVPSRTPEGDAAFVEALRTAENPVTQANLLTLIRELQVPNAIDPVLPFLSDTDADVRAEAADTVGSIIADPRMTPTPGQRSTALAALRARWDVETDDVVRSCLVYALAGFSEPGLRSLFESCQADADGEVRKQGWAGLALLDTADQGGPSRRLGTELQGEAGTLHPDFLAETIHRYCCQADPYGLGEHPRQRDIRQVLKHGRRERVAGQNIVTIRGRFFDLVLEEDRRAGWTVHVTDPKGLLPCRSRADHRHRVRLQPLSPETAHPTMFDMHRAEMFPALPSGPDYARDYRTADDVLDGITHKPDGAWFVIEPRTRASDAAFVEALRRANRDPAGTGLRGILCHILADLKTPDAVDPVTDAVTDPDPGVQYEAVRALDRIVGSVPGPPRHTLRAQQVLTDLWHRDIDGDLRSTVAGALASFRNPDLRRLLAEHRDSADDRTRRLCRNGISYLNQYDPTNRRDYTGTALQGWAAGYDDDELAFLLHRDIQDRDPFAERPHPREHDIEKALRWGHRERVPGKNIVRITGRHLAVTIDEDEPDRCDVAFLDPADPGLPACRLPWHRKVSTGFSATAIGTDGHIASGPNNTGRAPQDA